MEINQSKKLTKIAGRVMSAFAGMFLVSAITSVDTVIFWYMLYFAVIMALGSLGTIVLTSDQSVKPEILGAGEQS